MTTSNNYEDIFAIAAEGRYTANITGDACVGDEIIFAQAMFTGSFRKPKFSGYRFVEATIIRDSYGADKGQHTFTLQLANGEEMRIKGRNLYAKVVMCKNASRADRKAALAEKHERGDFARACRAARREELV